MHTDMTGRTDLSGPPAPSLIVDFNRFATDDHDLAAVCDRAAATVVTGLQTDCCHIYRPSPDHHTLESVASVCAYEPGNGDGPHEVQRLARLVLAGDNPAMAETLAGPVNSMSVLIGGETTPFGVFIAYSRKPRTFGRNDVEFVQCIASILSGVLRRAHYIRDRARLTTVVASAGDAIIEVTKEGRIFNWNGAAETLLGYPSVEILGKSMSTLFPNARRPGSPAILDLMSRTEMLGPMEVVLRRSDGTNVETLLRVAPVVLPDGRITAASLIARDLREKHRAEQALRMHSDILAHLPNAVVVWRLDDLNDASSLRLVLANPAADDVTGFAPGARSGALFAEMTVGGEEGPDGYAEVVRTAEPHDFGERWLGCADGSRRAFHVQAFPLPDQCLGVVFHDVTERREIGDRLRHAHRLEVIGRLAAGIAHDFQNLLTVIDGYTELLQPALASNASALEDLRQIEGATRSAQELTGELLGIVRRHVP